MRLAFAASLAFLSAAAFFRALRFGARVRLIAWCICSAVVALSPALIELTDPAASFARFFASLLSITWLVKLYDARRSPRRFRARGFPFYALHLMNCLWLVVRREPPGVSRPADVFQLAVSAVLCGMGIPLGTGVFSFDWSGWPFAIEHSIKVATVFALLMPAAALGSAAWRLFIGPACEAMNAPFLARTPAEFWRRWNIPAQQFFATYVFEPAGGLRHPVRATLFTFVVSGAIHEYVFGIATGRLQGWQMLFFLVQGCAVTLTSRCRPRGGMAVVGFFLTLAFNLATSVWFFRSVAAAVPFYVER